MTSIHIFSPLPMSGDSETAGKIFGSTIKKKIKKKLFRHLSYFEEVVGSLNVCCQKRTLHLRSLEMTYLSWNSNIGETLTLCFFTKYQYDLCHTHSDGHIKVTTLLRDHLRDSCGSWCQTSKRVSVVATNTLDETLNTIQHFANLNMN